MFLYAFFLLFMVIVSHAATAPQKRCQSPAIAPQRIEKVIAECQEEIRLAIIQEALDELEFSADALASRTKREAFTEDERRIAGCLLQCVYRKTKAVDAAGIPTREGLVHLYADGVEEKGYYEATAQASQQCLQIVQQNRIQSKSDGKQACDMAYNIFECISNKISEYCSGTK